MGNQKSPLAVWVLIFAVDELHYKESMLHVQKNTQSDLFSSLPTPLQNAENKNKGFKGCLYEGFLLVLLFQH